MSQNAYLLVEVLTEHARSLHPTVTADSFAEAARLAADLGDAELMCSAWS
jgi:hypothetical protein